MHFVYCKTNSRNNKIKLFKCEKCVLFVPHFFVMTNRQTNRHKDRQRNIGTDRQTERHTEDWRDK
jgi:hypothetical protein